MRDLLQIDNPFALELDVPRLAEYFGLWAILEDPFRAAVARAESIDLHVHVAAEQARRGADASASPAPYEVTPDGVAVIPIHGAMMKRVDSFSRGTSTVHARQQIRAAVTDAEVVGILLHVESPGGTVAGTSLLADEVKAAAAKKPVHAYIEDTGASAAYWVASQASRVYANRTAIVGSIGTYGVIYDQSARATLEGVKVHVIRAGEFKGAGEPGTEISAAQLAEWKRVVDGSQTHFSAAVADGRRLAIADVDKLADGRVHIGQEAVDAKLIDGIRTLDETLSELTTSTSKRRKHAMTQQNATADAAGETLSATLETAAGKLATPAATFDELVAGLVGADNDFIVAQLRKKATMDQARADWMAEQNTRLEAAEKARDDAQAAGDVPGVDPVGTGNVKGQRGAAAGGADGNEFLAAVAEKQAAGLSKAKAIRAVAVEQPDLHEAYLDGYNQTHGRRRRAG